MIARMKVVRQGSRGGAIVALILAVLAAGFAAGAAQAERHPDLEVVIGAEAPRAFSREALAAMPQTEIVTHTPWTEGAQVFRGVALAALLDGVDESATLELTALNAYSVSIPADAISDDLPVIAIERNGAPMSVREKGPYWLVYPFDETAFQTETFYSRSIWQLVRITVEP